MRINTIFHSIGFKMAEKEVFVRGKVSESLKARFKAACALINKPMDQVMAELIEDWLKTQNIK